MISRLENQKININFKSCLMNTETLNELKEIRQRLTAIENASDNQTPH